MTEIIFSMKMEHVKDVVDIHIQSFPGFFLSFLGRDFLSQLYCGILTDPSGIAFIAVDNERIIGFVAGTDQPAGFYERLLKKRWWRFAIASFPAIIKETSAFLRLIRAFSMPKLVSAEKGRGTLMSIAVLPSEQKKGLARPLVKAFLAESVKRGLRYVDLTTDKKNNELANHFYVRQGFSLLRSFTTPEGREMNEYIIDLQV